VQTSLQTKALRNGDDPVDALLKGLHGSFWFAAGASFTAMLIAAVMLRGMGTFSPAKATSTTTEESNETDDTMDAQSVESKVDAATKV
jgi:hypothetical protein